MKLMILGAGGIGGYYGGRLVEAGADVHFLVRPARAAQLQADGLLLESPLGDARLKVNAVTEAGAAPAPEIILLACKAYDLSSALDAIAPAVRPGTIVLPLLNGIAHLEAISKRFPQAKVWGGIAHIGVTMTPQGRIKHLNQLNTMLFGAREGIDEPAERLAALLAGSPVVAEARPRIEQDLWDKFVFLATLAGITCLMRASIGAIVATPSGPKLIQQLLEECRQIAGAEGFAPDDKRLERYQADLTKKGSPMTASMLRDLERGAPTEAEHVLGDLARRAEKFYIATPLLEIALTHLRAYDLRRMAD